MSDMEERDIRLRFIKETDLMQIANWRMSPEVTKYMYTDPILTFDNQLHWYTQIQNNDRCKYWVIEVNKTAIGLVSLIDIDLKNKKMQSAVVYWRKGVYWKWNCEGYTVQLKRLLFREVMFK